MLYTLLVAEATVAEFALAERSFITDKIEVCGIHGHAGYLYPRNFIKHVRQMEDFFRSRGIRAYVAEEVLSRDDGLAQLGMLDESLLEKVKIERVLYEHRLITWSSIAGSTGARRACACRYQEGPYYEHVADIILRSINEG